MSHGLPDPAFAETAVVFAGRSTAALTSRQAVPGGAISGAAVMFGLGPGALARFVN
jgi:hypothetical protein